LHGEDVLCPIRALDHAFGLPGFFQEPRGRLLGGGLDFSKQLWRRPAQKTTRFPTLTNWLTTLSPP
jgi:hypothetical protein